MRSSDLTTHSEKYSRLAILLNGLGRNLVIARDDINFSSSEEVLEGFERRYLALLRILKT